MKYVGITLQLILGLYFTWLGLLQIIAPPEKLQADFIRWGYELWFVPVVGTVELMGGVGLLIGLRFSRVAGLAALWLSATMTGAILTHINSQDGGWPLPLMLLLLCLAIVRSHLAALYTLVRGLKR
jgi:uncharacterized membrane protein YphA (DoxX/SURF4 family)